MAVTELSLSQGYPGVPELPWGLLCFCMKCPTLAKAGPPLFAVTLVIVGFELSSPCSYS